MRRLLHATGLRNRADFAPLGGRGRADVVFTGERIMVFIDGCFWRVCPIHTTRPQEGTDYWGRRSI